jgi:hypothetical protein
MDLNQLYSSQQHALISASSAAHPAARDAHLARAARFAGRIDTLRRAMGAPAQKVA